MKYMKMIMIILGFFLGSELRAQEGVRFEELSLKEALEKATQENKLVFIDCYTSWCSPCKEMAATVFTLPEAGKFLNGQFICLKIDMEKGEGPEIAKKYGVSSYPTFLLLDTNGEVKYELHGKMSFNNLKEKITTGLKIKGNISDFSERFEKNLLSKEETDDYITLLTDQGNNNQLKKVVEKLFPTLSDSEKINKRYLGIFLNSAVTPTVSDNFNFFLNHKAEFDRIAGADYLNKILEPFYNQVFFSYAAGYYYKPDSTKVQIPVEIIIEQAKKLNLPTRQHLLELKLELAKARCTPDMEKMIETGNEIVAIPIANEEDLTLVAYFFMTLDARNDKDLLDKLTTLESKYYERIQNEDTKKMVKNGFGRQVLKVGKTE